MDMEASQLQSRIDAVPWYHEFEFGNGLKARSKTPDIEGHRRNWKFIEKGLSSIDFRGKTVLDVGCWDGYWSFYAERRGARSVLAADDFSQNWSGGDGLILAKELLGSAVETNLRLSVYELASLGRTFDIILFLGVYYHLLDPLYALTQLRHCCHPGTVVLVEGNEGVNLPANAAVFDLDQHTTKFLPTAGHLRQMLLAAYFSVTAEEEMEVPQEKAARLGWRWRLRMCWQALSGSRSGVRGLIEPLTAIKRVFLTCVPFEGENPAHVYRPPFGLDAFDVRFKSHAPAARTWADSPSVRT
jgi:tRNA (mo5U34)-methyltransferase